MYILWLLKQTRTPEHLNIPVKSLSNNAFLIGLEENPIEADHMTLRRHMLYELLTLYSDSSKHSYDSQCHSSGGNRCAQKARKQENVRSVREERGRRDTFISSVMKDKTQYQDVWETIFHHLFTLGLCMTVCVLEREKGNLIFCPSSSGKGSGRPGNLVY